jgi:hypothetical protein
VRLDPQSADRRNQTAERPENAGLERRIPLRLIEPGNLQQGAVLDAVHTGGTLLGWNTGLNAGARTSTFSVVLASRSRFTSRKLSGITHLPPGESREGEV